MSQVTDALKGILTGFVASQPFGSKVVQAQQQQQELEQAHEYHQQSLDLEQKRLQEEQRLHDAQIAQDQARLGLEKAQATHSRIATRVALSQLSPEQLMKMPGVTVAQDLPDAIRMRIGHILNIPGMGESGEPEQMTVPSQEDYLENIRKEAEAKQGPQLENRLELERMRNTQAMQALSSKIDANQQIIESKIASAQEISDAKNENNLLKALMQQQTALMVSGLKYGNPANFDPSPYVNRIKGGEISEEQLKSELGGRIGEFNAVRDAATKAGYAIPDKKQVTLLRGLGPAVNIIPKMYELNNQLSANPISARTPFTNTNAITNRLSNEINEGLLSVQPQISQNTRLSDPRINRLVNSYGITKDVFSNTAGSRAKTIGDYQDLLNDIFDANFKGMSQDQISHIKRQLSIPPRSGEVVTDPDTNMQHRYVGGNPADPNSWQELKQGGK